MAPLAKLAGAALLLAHASAFSPAGWPVPVLQGVGGVGGGELAHAAARRAPLVAAGLRCQLGKVEASAVQRMTKGYDKLCKNCPTRLQPRVDTLTEVSLPVPPALSREASPSPLRPCWTPPSLELLCPAPKFETAGCAARHEMRCCLRSNWHVAAHALARANQMQRVLTSGATARVTTDDHGPAQQRA
jgi:hypothetical protein